MRTRTLVALLVALSASACGVLPSNGAPDRTCGLEGNATSGAAVLACGNPERAPEVDSRA